MTTFASNSAVPFSPSQRWLKAIELTARLDSEPHRLLGDVVAEWAKRQPGHPALQLGDDRLTYAALSERVHRYARWALAQGLKPGDRVALLRPTGPDYVAAWMGISLVGGIVALINTHLQGEALKHVLHVAKAGHVIATTPFIQAVHRTFADSEPAPRIWVEDELNPVLARYSSAGLTAEERKAVALKDAALLIYTSGTTGLPKAAYVSHHRVMSWGYWFAGLMSATPEDRLYNCLPLYHSVGGVVAVASMLAAGGTVVLAEKFSASRFWSDIKQHDCSIFQYIGELCRYLLKTPLSSQDRAHCLRMACGNGLRGDVWEEFQQRFAIPQILEFYAATEGNFSLFNVEGKPGSIGRIPPYLSHRFPAAIVKFDVESGKPLRGPEGLCIRAARGEAGEALGRMSGEGGGRFEGYTTNEDTEKKVLRDVLAKGDAWFRTGDLMRIDEKGFYYFVDRIGDTFRWKGENVATAEVAAAIAAAPGVADVAVYGVEVPGADGKAGMAAIVAESDFDPAQLYQHLSTVLPAYARPVFLRLRSALDLTETFKQKRQDLVHEGFGPKAADPILFADTAARNFVPLTADFFADIMAGRQRF